MATCPPPKFACVTSSMLLTPPRPAWQATLPVPPADRGRPITKGTLGNVGAIQQLDHLISATSRIKEASPQKHSSCTATVEAQTPPAAVGFLQAASGQTSALSSQQKGASTEVPKRREHCSNEPKYSHSTINYVHNFCCSC